MHILHIQFVVYHSEANVNSMQTLYIQIGWTFFYKDTNKLK